MTAFATVFGGLAANGIALVAVYHVQIDRAKKHLVVRNEAIKRRDKFIAGNPQNWTSNLRRLLELERQMEDILDSLRERAELLKFQLELASRKGGQTYRPRREEAKRSARDEDDGPGAGSSASMNEDDGPGAGR